MIVFPNCPKFEKSNNVHDSKIKCEGILIPLSSSTREYAKWKCTICGHEIK